MIMNKNTVNYLLTFPIKFQRFVSKNIDTDCWNWTGYKNEKGYGRFGSLGKVVSRVAHKFAYIHLFGKVKAGYELDHLCRNRGCVNPFHLEQVSHQKNMSRAIFYNSKKIFCKNGHPLFGLNLKVRACGRRRCIQCNRNYKWNNRGKNDKS